MSQSERRLAAIMFTDIVGYTSLTQKSEALAVQLLEMHRSLVRPFFPKHNGREVKTIGDAFLVEFASALEAVRCAFDIQQSMHELNLGRSPEKQIQLRVGVHVGDVIHRENDVYGDAVNVASRIEPLATPGGMCVSDQVYYQIRNKFEFPLVSLGKKELKNVDSSVEVFRVAMPWEQPTDVGTTAYPAERIAILPFASFSPDPNDAYFADGITDEIISAVAGISGLSVISRTSVVGYKGTTKRVEEIGRELKVGSILEGTFKKAGNKIRVTTQLINVAEDKHLWAQNYDRNLDDVFEVQSDVARQVADALRVKILSHEIERIQKRPTENTTAYTLYLKGRYLWNSRGLDEIRKAAECFEQAVKDDSSFAPGYVGQADCCLILRNNWNLDIDLNLEKARAFVTKALELDHELAEAHATYGLVLSQEYNLREAEKEFKKAIELKPSYAMVHMWYSGQLQKQLQWDESLRELETSLKLDPLSPVANLNHGAYYVWKRDYPRALELFKRAAELGFPGAHGWMSYAYGKMRMFDDMRRELAIHARLIGGLFPMFEVAVEAGIAYYEGDRETVKRVLPEIETHLRETGFDAGTIALYHFYLGENDKGFEWLERSYSRREDTVSSIAVFPDLDGVRTDPRYLDLLKRLGLDKTTQP